MVPRAGLQAGSKGVPGEIVTQATIETVTKSVIFGVVIFGVGVKTPDWRIEMFSFYSGPKNTGGTDPTTPVPVPATLALFGLGLAGLGWSRRKKA